MLTQKSFFNSLLVQKGKDGDSIRIPVVEGENTRRADRNKLLGALVIKATEIKRDVPANSEVEISIDIDQSRIIRTKAYIPHLDEEFETILEFEKKAPDHDKLEKEVKAEKARLEKMRKKAQEINDLKALQVLARIDGENMEHELDIALAASRVDRDAAEKCQNRLLDLRVAIDEVEDALEWPALLAEAAVTISDAQKVCTKYGTSSDNQKIVIIDRELRIAMESRDPDLLNRKINEMEGLRFQILREQPGWWVGYLEYMEEKKNSMRDQSQADHLIAQGRRAIDGNDLPQLKAVVRQLIALLPPSEQQAATGYGGSTTR